MRAFLFKAGADRTRYSGYAPVPVAGDRRAVPSISSAFRRRTDRPSCAFARQARKEGWTKAEIDAVLNEAKSRDYDHLLCTLSAYCEDPADEDVE